MNPAVLVMTAAVVFASAGAVIATSRTANLLPAAGNADAAPGSIVEVASGAGTFKTLLAAAKAAGLADALASTPDLTVFAPTDDAFAALGKDVVADLLKPENKAALVRVLSYHVVPAKVESAAAMRLSAADTLSGQRLNLRVEGGSLFIDSAKVIKADVPASNGVIHVIDKVLVPQGKDLAQLAMDSKDLTTLVTAVKAAGLAPALSAEGPLTVLAPTNAAFEALPKEALAALLKPENKGVLADVIKYHVIAGRTFSDQAIKAGEAATLQGQPVRFAVRDGQAMVGDAKIVAADIDAANGVVHVIDRVLIPEGVLKRLSASPSPANPADSVMTFGAQRELIQTAISLGAPMFNEGEPAACAAIYQVTAMALAADTRVGSHTRASLRKAMSTASAQHDHAERAWTLRRALDAALDAMPVASASAMTAAGR